MIAKKSGWGGKRPNAGRKREYVYIKQPVHFHVATQPPTPLTPQSDLSIYTAEMDENGRRGVMIGDCWYGAEEVLAIAVYANEHRQWLEASPE